MGLAGSMHCMAMCGAASTLAVQSCDREGRRNTWFGFHAGRVVGYAMAGALAASSVDVLARLGELSPIFRPLWTLVHLAAFGLGGWLIITGRQPVWFERGGRFGAVASPAVASPVRWHRALDPLKASAMGALWWAWPCGLLQSALFVAALAGNPAAGAVTMTTFAATSAVGLSVMPWWLKRLGAGGAGNGQRWVLWATRLSGLMLVSASGWALGHGLWARFLAYCQS
jgi:sulfite exporter TauE/SafE